MSTTRRLVAVMTAAAIASTGGLYGLAATPLAPSAQAQEQAAIGTMPTSGNLHIHKYIGLPQGDMGTGEEWAPTDPGALEPAAGVGYTVYEVPGTDLTTPAGWAVAEGIEVAELFTNLATREVNPELTVAHTGQTDGNGQLSFEGMDARQYLVVEEPTPISGGRYLTSAAPFLVTVPLTNPAGDGWLTDVNVYPKNQAIDGQPVKTVTDPEPTGQDSEQDLTGSSVGELIGYEISTEVPTLQEGASFPGFMITDLLPPELGEPSNVQVLLDGTVLSEGQVDTVVYDLDDQWVVRAQITGALEELTSADNLTLSFQAEVGEVTDGAVENQAWVLPGDPGLDAGDVSWDPRTAANAGMPSNVTVSKYGDLTIRKHSGEEFSEETALQDAEFALHRCTDGEVAGTELPIRVNGESTVTTGADGTAVISGIHLGNVQTGAEDGSDGWVDIWQDNGNGFCLVEVTAPAGYALLPAPVPVDLTASATSTAEQQRVTVDVRNVSASVGSTLPMTGGWGIFWILAAGALLILAGIIYAIRNRRAEQA